MVRYLEATCGDGGAREEAREDLVRVRVRVRVRIRVSVSVRVRVRVGVGVRVGVRAGGKTMCIGMAHPWHTAPSAIWMFWISVAWIRVRV